MTDIDTTWLDATAQAELVRRGEVTPSDLVEAACVGSDGAWYGAMTDFWKLTLVVFASLALVMVTVGGVEELATWVINL